MKVIDTHIHLESNGSKSLHSQIKEMSSQLKSLNIETGVLIHLLWQEHSIKDIATAVNEFSNLIPYVNINPNDASSTDVAKDAILSYGFKGIKLHPRFTPFKLETKECFEICDLAGQLGVPVVICTFPDSLFLGGGLDALQYFNLAKSCPDTKFVWAHMGGHKVLDFVMLGRSLKNVYMDFSYTLLYYQGSSVVTDLCFAFKNMKFERVFYGSDYPDRSLEVTLKESIRLLENQGLTEPQIQKLFYQNAKDFLENQ
jgi:predicted TIM-barrel fold metal-dependent hydrolase